ncbi:MAG TPA: methyltransferase [Acidimicrobiales bacterium]|jgi:hypothetical protein|nr:methyltransferase [Acidimicrobiales bacterium]
MTDAPPATFLFADRPEEIANLRRALDRAGYTVAGVRAAIGEHGFTFLSRAEVAPVVRRTAGGSPLDTLIRLFLCGVAVEPAAAEAALAPLDLHGCAAAGLVHVDAAGVVGGLKIRPYDVTGRQWLVAYDSAGRGAHRADFVLGIGAASLTLASMTVRPTVGSLLDLGTGSGIQALHGLGQAERIVATDRNPRAVAVAAFNFALNGATEITVRRGDLFAPVTGERFDLIVSNPPFVISPEDRFDYRDSGLPLDEICRRIVRQAGAHLNDGGWCQLLANWAHRSGEDWRARLAGWFEGTGCDAWVIQRDVEDIEHYASTWIRHEEPDPARTGEAFNRWMDFYQQAGIEAVGSGLITMRRTTRPTPWLRIEEVTQDIAVPSGDAIEATFHRLEWLAGRPEGDLQNQRLVVADDVRLYETRRVHEGRWVAEEHELRQLQGLRHVGSVDPPGAGLIAGCDGQRTVGQLIDRLADSVGADVTDVTPQAVAIVTRLVEQGFLLPLPAPAGEQGRLEASPPPTR